MKKNFFITLAAIFIYLILFSTATKVAGGVALIGGLAATYYLYKKSKKFKNKNKFIKFITGIGLAFFILFFGFGGLAYDENRTVNDSNNQNVVTNKPAEDDKSKEETNVATTEKDEEEKDNSKINGELKVHFINVGQADSILIQQGSENMLIDAGNNDDEGILKSYLSNQGINEFKYVIGTHAHEDHIGSMDYIINAYKIGKVYFPKQTATTKTFENFINACKSKGIQLTAPVVGESFNLGDAKCTILAPNGNDYKDANDYSIVLKVEFGSNSFLFTGDAEAVSEMEMVNRGINLKADLLKVGHHGSKSSTCANFLSSVNPKYAVISVGEGNSYGHPAQGTMDRLKGSGVKVFRTDENGTVVATSNGSEISFNTSPGSYNGAKETTESLGNTASNNSSNSSNQSSGSKPGTSNSSKPSGGSSSSGSSGTTTNEPATGSRTVYWVSGGKSYHYSKSCPTLSRSKNILEGPANKCPKTDPCDKCVK